MFMFTIAAPSLPNDIPGLHSVHYCQSMFAISAVGWSPKLAPTTGNNSLQPSSFGLMQEDHQQEPYYLRAKLVEAVGPDYNVIDVPLILEVLGKLESLPVTKEVLESTRLGKTVNDLRRKVKDAVLAKRLKDLVKKWRDAVLVNEPHPLNNSQSHPTLNGSSSGEGGPSGSRYPPNFNSGFISASSSPILQVPSSSSRISPALNNNNSLSPRTIGPLTNNYSNNTSTSVHGAGGRSNGSSSIQNNHYNQIVQQDVRSAFGSPASPHLTPRNLVSPLKSKSGGGPNLTNSNLSPLPSSHFQSATNSYAPNVETVSRTNVANKRYREQDDSPLSTSEPPSKRARPTTAGVGAAGVNGTLDDPLLALDDISRDSYASRGSDHSDGVAKEHRFSSSTLSPATPGQSSTLSPQMPVPGGGTDSNAPSPLALNLQEGDGLAQAVTQEQQPKKKRRRKQNEFYQDSEAILREKIAQAEAEKAAKAQREREAREKAFLESATSVETFGNNEFVEKYFKSQNELRAKMEREAGDLLSTGEASNGRFVEENSVDGFSIPHDPGSKEKKKKKKKLGKGDIGGEDISNSFPSESEILSKLPPIDPEILREFANFEYDVNPSPPPPEPSLDHDLETEGENSLSTGGPAAQDPEPKAKFSLDWGDSDEELEPQVQDTSQVQIEAEVIKESKEEKPPPSPATAAPSEDSVRRIKDPLLPTYDIPPFHRGVEIESHEVESYIKDTIPNLNGNHDQFGVFREWQETLQVESYKQEPLHILPYTIIDF